MCINFSWCIAAVPTQLQVSWIVLNVSYTNGSSSHRPSLQQQHRASLIIILRPLLVIRFRFIYPHSMWCCKRYLYTSVYILYKNYIQPSKHILYIEYRAEKCDIYKVRRNIYKYIQSIYIRTGNAIVGFDHMVEWNYSKVVQCGGSGGCVLRVWRQWLQLTLFDEFQMDEITNGKHCVC